MGKVNLVGAGSFTFQFFSSILASFLGDTEKKDDVHMQQSIYRSLSDANSIVISGTGGCRYDSIRMYDDKVEIMTIMMLFFQLQCVLHYRLTCSEKLIIGHRKKVPCYCLLLAIVDLWGRSRYQGQGQVITSHNICGI